MKKSLTLMLFLAFVYFSIFPLSSYGQTYTKIQGYSQQGGSKVTTQGLTSSTNVQKSFPSSTVTVFDAGTSNISTIYSNSTGTPKSNPFTADSTGYWFFYGIPGKRYDVRFSGTGISSPFTLGDFKSPQSSYVLASVTDFGAVGDGKIRQTATMTAASTTLTCSDCSFSSSDVGKKIDVNGAGGALTLFGTVTARNSATSITVDTRASFTTTNQTLIIGGRTVNDAASTAGSNIITSATASFQTYDINRRVAVTNAGASNLVTTIAGFTNSTTVTLTNPSVGVVSNKQVVFGTDDSTAFQNTINAANAIYAPDPPGDCYVLSSRTLTSAIGTIYCAVQITSSNKTILGDGPFASKLYFISTIANDSNTLTQGIVVINASNIQLKDIALHGTNKDGQQSPFGLAADGLYLDVVGTITNISSINCRFNNFWIIGWHNPGQTGGGGSNIRDFTIINCEASYNGADGFNPSSAGGFVIFQNNRMYYNGTGGLEATGNNSVYLGNIAIGNFSTGYNVGGLGDPEVANNITFNGNIAENNVEGIIFGPNVQGLVAIGNTSRFNYNTGISISSQVDRTLTKNNIISNNIVLSNGGIGASAPFGISLTETTNTIVQDNYVLDEGISGFQQKAGVVANSSIGLSLLRNRISGHAIQDYSLSNCGDVDFINEIVSATVFASGTTVLVYPSPTFNNITINKQENLTPTIVADTSLNPFTPTNLRLVYTTLTGNRTLDSFNGTDGQVITFIFVQDGTGNRTLTCGGTMKGCTNISAGQAAGKANTQTFIYRSGVGWMALTQAVQNQ